MVSSGALRFPNMKGGRMKYEWKWRAAPIDAQTVGEELERIRSLTGKLLPKDVVKEAQKKKSPLHSAFEWDDEIAGEKYRVSQARTIIRSVLVMCEDAETAAPAFVHIPKIKGGQYYQNTKIAVQNVDEFVLAVGELSKKITSAQTALDDLQVVAEGYGVENSALLSIAAQALVTAKETIAKVY